MDYDYHVHSNYSDGAPLEDMVAAGVDVGLQGIGIADHCNVSGNKVQTRNGLKTRLEYADLQETYLDRRAEIRALDNQSAIRIFDTVELDYFPGDERNIRRFIHDAGFDYTIGSIHFVDGIHFCNTAYFGSKPAADRRALLDEHLRDVVALVESELFDIAAHVDVFERYPPFRGLVERSDYEPLIEAFHGSRTIPEINIGRLFSSYADTNPRMEIAEHFVNRGIEFTYGSDAHGTGSLVRNTEYLQEELSDAFDFVTLDV